MTQQWNRVLAVDELADGTAKTVRTAGEQIAVFRSGDAVYAVDNRCPHEGYPLASGDVKDGLLTCAWHNWKFQLCDGECVLGGEAVRAYPVRVEDGHIYIDVQPPPKAERVPGLLRSLDDAFEEASWGQVARTVARLLDCDLSPAKVLAFGCEWAATHAKYGFDHGLAATADLAALLEEPPFRQEPELLIVEAFNLMVEPNLRRPLRELPAPAQIPAGLDLDTELRRLVEAEELEAAEALLRGAIAAGATADEVFAWLTHAATDHFLDFGHAHIYCVKAEELLAVLGWEHADPIAVSLLTMIVYGTREDTLPYMKRYRREVEPLWPRLAGWAARESSATSLDFDQFRAHILDGELGEALGAVATTLDAGVPPHRIALALAACAAERLLRFDVEIEHSDDIGEGWLDVTHSLTHADAVRETLLRRPDADNLRGLFHSARFINHLQPLDAPADHRVAVASTPAIDELVASVVDDRFTAPIFVDHHIKTTLAARRISGALAADAELSAEHDLPRAATARFVASSITERRIRRTTRNSKRFVATGRRQQRLLGY